MSRQTYLTKVHGNSTWNRLLDYFVEKADAFHAYFPYEQGVPMAVSNPDDLGYGKEEFLSLPDISIHRWNGMANCLVISGLLTEDAQQLFRVHATDASQRSGRRLWQYSLLHDGVVLLHVSDYNVALASLSPAEITNFQKLDVDIGEWPQADVNLDDIRNAHLDESSMSDKEQKELIAAISSAWKVNK